MMGPQSVIDSLGAKTKREALVELAKAALQDMPGERIEGVVDILLDREKLGSTGIGDGTAIPHGKVPALHSMRVAFGRSLEGIDFNALDGKPVHLFFLLLAPENSQGMHLRVLAKISRMARDASFRAKLMEAKGVHELYEIINDQDSTC